MEYGDDDEDDDLEEIAGDTLKPNSNVQIASKPFWAVWSWKISSLLIFWLTKRVYLYELCYELCELYILNFILRTGNKHSKSRFSFLLVMAMVCTRK